MTFQGQCGIFAIEMCAVGTFEISVYFFNGD